MVRLGGKIKSEDTKEFREAFYNMIKGEFGFYVAEVSRSRSLARFASAMFIPSILFGCGVGLVLRPYGAWLLGFSIAFGSVAAVGFAWRYKRYQARFYEYVICSKDGDWSWRCIAD